jgi:transcriptional regulator with XRE-family HTH domain
MFSPKDPATYARDLGQRLRELRLQRNLRQRDVAADAGLSAPTLRALESGRGTIEALAKVMYVLGRERELDQLLEPDPPSSLEELTPAPRKRARR